MKKKGRKTTCNTLCRAWALAQDERYWWDSFNLSKFAALLAKIRLSAYLQVLMNASINQGKEKTKQGRLSNTLNCTRCIGLGNELLSIFGELIHHPDTPSAMSFWIMWLQEMKLKAEQQSQILDWNPDISHSKDRSQYRPRKQKYGPHVMHDDVLVCSKQRSLHVQNDDDDITKTMPLSPLKNE